MPVERTYISLQPNSIHLFNVVSRMNQFLTYSLSSVINKLLHYGNNITCIFRGPLFLFTNSNYLSKCIKKNYLTVGMILRTVEQDMKRILIKFSLFFVKYVFLINVISGSDTGRIYH